MMMLRTLWLLLSLAVAVPALPMEAWAQAPAPSPPPGGAPSFPSPPGQIQPPIGAPAQPPTGAPTQPPAGTPAQAPGPGQPPTGAQAPGPPPTRAQMPVMPPPAPLQAPTGMRPFPTPPEVVGRELTLEEAVQIGLDNAPKIAAATGDYLAARQRVYEALSPLLPQITGQWNGFQNKSVSAASTVVVPGQANLQSRTISQTFVSTTATVTASQLLFDFGKNWAATDVAKFNAESFRQTVELQRQTISVNVKTAYFTLLLAKRLVGVNIAALDRSELNLRSARGFFEVGTQPRFFVTRAEVDVANARVSLIQSQNALALARVSLNTAMGIAVNAPTEIKDILAYEPYSVDRDALVTDAFRRRPEYLQIKALADAADASVRQRFRNFFPNIFASGTYGSTRPEMSEIYNYGVQLTWSIFDGGNIIAQYKEAKANLDAVQARIRDTELTIWQDVQQAYLNMIAAEQQIGAAQTAVDSAQENFRLSQGRFDAGVGTIIELTDAQLALTQAQSNEAQALANYRIAIAQLERASGQR
jgi:outer membrane protein